MVLPSYPVQTARLDLRPFALPDLEPLLDIRSRPEVSRYLYDEPFDRDGLRAALVRKTRRTALVDAGDSLNLAVVVRETGALVGECSLGWRSAEHRQGEIGYILHPDHNGRGYATEAGAAMLAIGFEDLGLHRIVGRMEARNTASARVLERLGMRREAHLVHNERVKGEWNEELIYALLEHEWAARGR